MCEECAPYLPVYRLLGSSGFDNTFDRVEYAANYNTQEIIFLGGSLMWNDTAVCGGIMELHFL